MGVFRDILGTLRSTFQIGKATLDSSGLSVARTITLPDAAGEVVVNPMTTAGDMIVGGADGVPARLAKGTALQVLRMNAAATAQEYATIITVSTSDPSGGADGDVWLKYTA